MQCNNCQKHKAYRMAAIPKGIMKSASKDACNFLMCTQKHFE